MWIMTSKSREKGLIEFWIGRVKIAECHWNYVKGAEKGFWTLEVCLDEDNDWTPKSRGPFDTAGDAMKAMHELLNAPNIHA